MDIKYSEEDQKLIDTADQAIKDYTKYLVNYLESQGYSASESVRMIQADRHRSNLIEAKERILRSVTNYAFIMDKDEIPSALLPPKQP